MNNTNQIQCPHCNKSIDVSSILIHQAEERVRQETNRMLEAERNSINHMKEELLRQQLEAQNTLQNEAEIIRQKVDAGIREEQQKLEESLRQSVQAEEEERRKRMQQELDEKSRKIKELHGIQADLERMRREKEELQGEVEAKAMAQLNQRLQQERDKLRADAELKYRELEKKYEDQMKLTDEMKRKQDQGPIQRQGEVQEQAIEDWLRSNFPLDEIIEIKKGAKGADSLQVINTYNRPNCGRIYFESKRTQTFDSNWITKFKEDMKKQNADIGILVTQTLPKGVEKLQLIDGVWVSSFTDYQNLALVLRESTIRLSEVAAFAEHKGEKMEMLYQYLTSNAFRMQFETIIGSFSNLREGIEKEKIAMQKIWKQREKEIERVISSTIDMYATMKGIGGSDIQTIRSLELGADTDEPTPDAD